MESLKKEREVACQEPSYIATKDDENVYENAGLRNQKYIKPHENESAVCGGTSRALEICQKPPGNGQVFPIRNDNMSVRAEIENKLLEEICGTGRTPGLYERQRTHSAGARYHIKRQHSPARASDTSPFIKKMNEKLRRDVTFYGEDPSHESPFWINGGIAWRKQPRWRPGAGERNNSNDKITRRRTGSVERNDDKSNRNGHVGGIISDASEDSVRIRSKEHLKMRSDSDPPEIDAIEDASLVKNRPEHDKNIVEKIKLYNRGISMEAFLIQEAKDSGKLDFHGVLRFYLDEEGQQVSKAIRLKTSTTIRELLPLVTEKFKRERHQASEDGSKSNTGIFLRRPDGDLPLGYDDRPLDLALTSHSRPRFIVRFSESEGNQNNNISPTTPIAHSNDEAQTTSCHSFSKDHRHVNNSRKKVLKWGQSNNESSSPMTEASVGALNNMEGGLRLERRASVDEECPAQQPRRRKKEKKDKKERRDRSLDRISDQLSIRKGSMRLSRSMTNLVHKTFSLRQKENPFRRQSELSTEETAPGVLKIFGDTIIPGAEYKSVLATPTSSAKELAKEALERYGISRRQVRHYVLCDVIGKFVPKAEATQEVVKKAKSYRRTEKGVWLEECLRVVSDNERPLTIQKFWKPTPEFSRRFELRKRSELVRNIDNFTSGINANARRLLLSKARLDSVRSQPLCHEHSDSSPDSANDSFMGVNEGEVDGLTRTVSVSKKSKNRAEKHDKGLVKAPANHPYFLSLKSFDSTKDNLLYIFRERVTMVGRSNSNIGEDDICLHAPDILIEHCWISKAIDDSGLSSMTIDPLPGATVRINGNPVTATAQLHPGDLISLGDNYLFLLKKPSESVTTITQEENLDLSVLKQTLDTISNREDGGCPVSKGLEEEPEMLKWRRDRRCKYDSDSTRIKLNFVAEKRDVLIDYIMTIMDSYPHAPKLTLAYLVSMCVDFSLARHDIATTRNLLSALSSTIQTVVWEATKTLADKQANLSDDNQGNVHGLIQDLQTVNLWLSNAVELHYYFRKNVRDALRMFSSLLPHDSQESESLPEDEIVVVLEDVIMYCFQQTVYYLTKALYAVLPAVLESNPFINDVMTASRSNRSEVTVDDLISILHATLATMTELSLHPSITSQLFCYLFFFTSTSLFNMLMNKEAGSKFYRWSKGAQLRGNLDAIEAWASASGLGREAQVYMIKVNNLANLLATPKVQLLTASWHDLQRDFPDLKNEQLLKVLSEYDVGPGKEQPESWVPPDGAINPSTWSSRLQESFSNYPPLKLPKSAFNVDLSAEVHDELLIDIAQHISSEFGISDDDRDSGLSVSQTLPVFTDIPQSPVFMEDQDQDFESPNKRTFTLSSPLLCRPGPSNYTSNTSCPVPPKRRTKEERRKALSLEIPKQTLSTSCDTASVESPRDGKQKEPDLGDSGISMSCEQKDFRYENTIIYSPGDKYDQKSEDHVDKCHASQAMSNTGKHCSRESRSQTWSHDRMSLDLRMGTANVSHHNRHGSGKLLKPQGSGHNNSCTCTGPLAMSSPVSSDSSTPCPSPVDGLRIPPQPRDPAPTLDRSSLKKKKKEEDIAAGRKLAASPTDESKVVEIKHLMPPSPDGMVNGLRVLPLSDLEEDVSPSVDKTTEAEAHNGETDLLRTIEGDNRATNQGEDDDGHPAEEEQEDVIIVNLEKGDRGLGLGLIDGLFTPLRQSGIYVWTLVPGEPAEKDCRLQIGDRILAVNGKSIVGSDYQSAMKTIRESGIHLSFLVAQGNRAIRMQITASSC